MNVAGLEIQGNPCTLTDYERTGDLPRVVNRSRFILFALLVLSDPAYAQSRPSPPIEPKRIVVSRWNLDEGLPQSSVNAILQSRDGYLWLATFGGLVRFDGVRFTVFDRSNTPSLRSDRCVNLFEDSRGRIWAGTEGGVAVVEQGSVRFFGRPEGLSAELVNAAVEDAAGTIWIATGDRRLHRFDGNGFDPTRSVSLGDRNAIRSSGTTILVATTEDIRRFDGTQFEVIHRFSRRIPSNVRTLLTARDGSLWVTTNGSGVVRIAEGQERWYGTADGIPDLHLAAIAEAADGSIWIGSVQGAVHLVNGRATRLTTADGLSDYDIKSAFVDREQNVWIGTSTGGLNRLRQASVTVYGQSQGLREEKILSIALRADGSLLFGSNCGGLHEWRDGRAFDSPLSRFLVNECIWSVFEDRSGTLWIGSDELQQIRNDRVVARHTIPSPYATFEDRSGQIWVGTAEGLYVRNGQSLVRHLWSDRLPHHDVRALFEDRDGAIWVGTVNGFARGVRDSVQAFTAVDGLASHYIRAFAQEADGTMWLGSYGGGLVRLKHGRFAVLTTRHGLFDNIVSHLVIDRDGDMWMGSNRGIARVTLSELNLVADGEKEFVAPVTLGRSDGLESVETNGGFQPNAALLPDGRIAFPTVAGLAIVDPQALRTNQTPPPVVIEDVLANGRPLPSSRLDDIPYDEANLEIRYTALNLTEPTKVRFRYRLAGYDDGWIDANTRRTAFYTKLPPGTHRFQVLAANHHGVWNETGAHLTLTVTPPFYLTWWFIAAAIICFLSVGPAIYAYRVGALKREREAQRDFSRKLLESQEAERRRIAAELHDGLGQNLLIVKNRAAMALQNPGNVEQLVAQLQFISDGASAMIGEARSIAHNLRPAHLERFGLTDTLRAMIDQVAGTTTVRWSHSIDLVDGAFAKEDEMSVFRIVQEAMNNIVKHANATEADITVSVREHEVVIEARDDGRGFSPGSRPAFGLGLTGIEERTRLLGGTSAIRSAPGSGTVLVVTLPRRKGEHV